MSMSSRVSALGEWARDHRGAVLALVLLVLVLTAWRMIEPTYSDVRGAPAGTCFAESPAVTSANRPGEVHLVAGSTQAQTVDCASEHVWETAAVEQLAGDAGTAYDADAVAAAAQAACAAAFEPYVGRPLEGSSLAVTARYPTKAEWDGNERRVVCLLVDPVAQSVTGSLRDANR
ncbi:MAG: septum formation family protein [Chloroflexi bacterium]|nr:septum formation family protein [Chloroflexota bacterium]